MVSVVDYTESRNCLLYRSFGTTLRNSARLNRLGSLRKGMSFFRRLLEHLTRNGMPGVPRNRGVGRARALSGSVRADGFRFGAASLSLVSNVAATNCGCCVGCTIGIGLLLRGRERVGL